MKKFLVTYHAPVDAMAQTANATPEQQAKGMEGWMQWAQRTGNKLKDLGAPLTGSQRIGVDGSSRDSDKQIVGYSMLEAENMDEAKSLLAGHPHTSGWHPDASIELHEVMPISGM